MNAEQVQQTIEQVTQAEAGVMQLQRDWNEQFKDAPPQPCGALVIAAQKLSSARQALDTYYEHGMATAKTRD